MAAKNYLGIGCLPFLYSWAFGQNTSFTQALGVITQTANQICQTAPLDVTTTSTTLSADATVKLGGAIGRIADLGLSGAVQYQQGRSIGLLQKDMVEALKSGNDCKLVVFKILERDLIGTVAAVPPRESPLVETVPEPFGLKDGPTYLVFFDRNSSDLTVRDEELIDKAAHKVQSILGAGRIVHLQVTAYSSGQGDYSFGQGDDVPDRQELAHQRAASVANELVKIGVPNDVIHRFSYILNSNDSAPRRPQDRRAEIIFRQPSADLAP